jgi:hypothetical protein
VVGCGVHGDELFGFIKGGNFLPSEAHQAHGYIW